MTGWAVAALLCLPARHGRAADVRPTPEAPAELASARAAVASEIDELESLLGELESLAGTYPARPDIRSVAQERRKKREQIREKVQALAGSLERLKSLRRQYEGEQWMWWLSGFRHFREDVPHGRRKQAVAKGFSSPDAGRAGTQITDTADIRELTGKAGAYCDYAETRLGEEDRRFSEQLRLQERYEGYRAFALAGASVLLLLASALFWRRGLRAERGGLVVSRIGLVIAPLAVLAVLLWFFLGRSR